MNRVTLTSGQQIFSDNPAEKINYSDAVLCKSFGDKLEEHYPGWGWAVNIIPKGGVIRIQSLIITGQIRKPYGMTIKLHDVQYSQKVIKKNAIWAGGEILERAGIARGPYKGQQAKFVEGVKQKHQPIQILNQHGNTIR